MFDGIDAIVLARAQFAFTMSFHIVFPAFSIGLASYLAVLEALWLWTGREVFINLFNYWLKIFAVAFGMGVVSGIVMSYQFGTNWAVFSDKTGPVLGPLMAYSGFDGGKVKLLGSGAWEFANIGNNDTFVGGWYPGPDPQGWRTFSGRFVKAFGQPPPRVASLAYDAVNLAVSLNGEPAGQRFTAANLTRPAGFAGVDGLIRFRQGGLAERALAILEVQKIGSIVVDPAAGALEGARVTAAQPARVN